MKRKIKWLKAIMRFLKKPFCKALGVAFVSVALVYLFSVPLEGWVNIKKDVLQASITIGAIFAGFDSVNKGTFLNLSSPYMEELRNSAYFDSVMKQLHVAFYAAICFILFSFCLLFISGGQYEKILIFVWEVLGFWMLFSFMRIHNIIDGHTH